VSWSGPTHINFALVEAPRPPMYTAMKYWGKKPHNIWAQYIESYCPPGGIVLDPFVGSGIAAFEAVKLGRRAIAFDLNPLTTFFIEVLSSRFVESDFKTAFQRVYHSVSSDPIYTQHYTKDYRGRVAVVSNYRWLNDRVVNVALEIQRGKKRNRYFVGADKSDLKNSRKLRSIKIPFWFPTRRFPATATFPHKFIKDIGGNSFEHLWTRRNLYLLARIFDEILREKDLNIRLQLLSGFIQTLHLTSKMVVPRNPKSHRDFSGSWGRADYMIRRRSMEQNPLVVFRRSCVEKQGVISAMRDASALLPGGLKLNDAFRSGKLRPRAEINFGAVDVADLDRYVPEKIADFAITDPPYAGLVQYLELSLVWLVWLEHARADFWPDLDAEITLKKGEQDRAAYRRRLDNAFKQLHRALKDDGFLVVTFHHKKLQEWNDFVKAVRFAGFKFDKVTHQYNRRSGEANVANPYGTSGADFYIRCVKHRDVDFTDDVSGLEHFVTEKAKEIISLRNEPTPYDFIIAGLVPEMLQAGYTQPQDYKNEINRILMRNVGPEKIFKVLKNSTNKAGDYWWFSDPNQHIAFPDRPLSDRVEEAVISILRRKISVKLDDVLGELFRTYPNGLTPDPRNITTILKKYATPSAGKWKIKPSTIRHATRHSEMIKTIAVIGRRAGCKIYIGRREQPEALDEVQMLRDLADSSADDALRLQYDREKLHRVQMIDVLWLSKGRVAAAFEVEHSTGFASAVFRASNLDAAIPKFMVVPEARENELLKMRDPLFLASVGQNNWKYATYDAVERLAGFSSPSLKEMTSISQVIK
jgi:hypothetical protein